MVIAVIALNFTGCKQSTQTTESGTSAFAEAAPLGQASVEDDVSDKNILQIAIGSADHSTLVAAVQAAKIEHVLANNGPLTVFAPVNSAFEKLPEGTVENLLKEENIGDLTQILTLHAAPGTYPTNFLKDGMKLYMATGHYLDVVNNEEGVFLNGAKILATVEASNGLIHVIDAVLLPPEE